MSQRGSSGMGHAQSARRTSLGSNVPWVRPLAPQLTQPAPNQSHCTASLRAHTGSHLGALLLLQQGRLGGKVLLGLLQLGGGGGQLRRQAVPLLAHCGQVGVQLCRAPLGGRQLLGLRGRAGCRWAGKS